MGEAIKVEHEGKIYSLCCEACVKAFKEDPEKFHKIADKEGKDHVDTEHSHSDHKHDEHK
jgi:YHS domain-containing protein